MQLFQWSAASRARPQPQVKPQQFTDFTFLKYLCSFFSRWTAHELRWHQAGAKSSVSFSLSCISHEITGNIISVLSWLWLSITYSILSSDVWIHFSKSQIQGPWKSLNRILLLLAGLAQFQLQEGATSVPGLCGSLPLATEQWGKSYTTGGKPWLENP